MTTAQNLNNPSAMSAEENSQGRESQSPMVPSSPAFNNAKLSANTANEFIAGLSPGTTNKSKAHLMQQLNIDGIGNAGV